METSSTSRAVGTARKLKRRPFVFGKLLRFVLRDFLFSPWPIILLALLAASQVYLFAAPPTRDHFFGVQYATTMVMAAIASGAYFSRAGRAETYAILARPVSRGVLTLALLVAAWLVAVIAYIVSSAVVLVRFGPWLEPERPVTSWLTAETFLLGSVPILLAVLVVVSLVALMSHFVSSTGVRLVILALIALLVMAFDNRNFPIEAVRPILEQLPPVIAPVAGALRFATGAITDPQVLYSLIALAAYALALSLLAVALSAGRETMLD